MNYAYKQQDGTLAFCSLQSSIPDGTEYIESNELPQDPWHEAFDIDTVNGKVIRIPAKVEKYCLDIRRADRDKKLAKYDKIKLKKSIIPLSEEEVALEVTMDTDVTAIMDENAAQQISIADLLTAEDYEGLHGYMKTERLL